METITPILLFVNAVVGILLIILILLQRSDPAAGGMFGGSGASSVVVRNPLARPTAILAAIFLLNCVVVAYAGQHGKHSASVMDAPVAAPANIDAAAPAAPVSTTTVSGSAVLPAQVSPTAENAPSATQVVSPTSKVGA
jgi:protein translocase SecG subunit